MEPIELKKENQIQIFLTKSKKHKYTHTYDKE
jgi:hypothetical protein